jgi:ABC-2 type transport system ATP-binding protein
VVNNLNKTVRKFQILREVSFKVPKGSICAFIGHNGAGKTTIIKSVMDLFQYESGEIKLNGANAKDTIQSHRNVGYVPERDFFPKTTGRIFLTDLCAYYQMSKKDTAKKIDYYARVFNCKNKLDTNMQYLSSGQKKKFLIIQALLHSPDFYILDEPTDNLDPDTREIFYKVISLLHKQGKTIFISTHNLDEIQNYATYLIILVEGQICYQAHTKNKNLYRIYDKYKPRSII